jgi:Rod binding domain-containing protein
MMSVAPQPKSKIDPSSPVYKKLMHQAKDLEGVFLNTLMKEMFSTIGNDTNSDTGDGDFAQSTWRDMQAEQLSNAVADQGGVGLANQLMPSLLAMQEAAPSNTGTGLQQ